jgi:hypothetical protein
MQHDAAVDDKKEDENISFFLSHGNRRLMK